MPIPSATTMWAERWLPVAGHVPLGVTMDEGAVSGMKTVEHFSESRIFRECAGKPQPYETERCRPLFDRLAANNVWQTPTLAFFRLLTEAFSGKPMPHAEYASDSQLGLMRKIAEASKLDDQALASMRAMSKVSLTVIKDMLPRGNRFLAGCDGGVPGFCLHDEIAALAEAGLSPIQALQTATINPARLLGREKTEGTIAAGKRANLVLLDANPLADIGAFSLAHPPETDFFVPTGVQYALETYRGGFLVTDGHHNRVLHVTRDGKISEFMTFGNIVPTGLAVSGNTIHLSHAGPVPHLPATGKVVSFGPDSSDATDVATGARLAVDVEFGRGRTLFALSQGVFVPGHPEGSPAEPDTGALLRVNADGTFSVVADGLDRPTSLEIIGNTAYVVSLAGEIWKIEGITAPPYGASR